MAKLPFATPIKQMLCTMLNCDLNMLEAYKESNIILDETGCTLRKLLQTLGTDWGRNTINNNIWVKLAKKYIILNSNKNIVISDVRFLNELEMIYDLNGFILYINREDNNDRLVNADIHHESEIYLTLIHNQIHQTDIIINNNFDIYHLHNEIDNAIKTISKYGKNWFR